MSELPPRASDLGPPDDEGEVCERCGGQEVLAVPDGDGFIYKPCPICRPRE